MERELGPIHTWVNVAMATVFGAVSDVSAAEVERGTRVTYLGQVHGMMSALKRMRSYSSQRVWKAPWPRILSGL